MTRSLLLCALAALVLGGWSLAPSDPPAASDDAPAPAEAAPAEASATDLAANGWQEMPGTARDIGAGANGSVWIVGSDRGVYQWNDNAYSWQQVNGSNARRITVAPDGTPWITNTDSRVFRRRGGNWQELPGEARDIAAGADSSVWAVGENRSLYKWNEDAYTWNQFSGSNGEMMAVTGGGTAWLVNADGNIYQRRGNNWQQMPGTAIDIAAGQDDVWIVGDNEAIYKWNESAFSWQQVSGSNARRIAVASDGRPWIINDDNRIFRRAGN
jgi:hypothetical protein